MGLGGTVKSNLGGRVGNGAGVGQEVARLTG
jgi:hypothetical protein